MVTEERDIKQTVAYCAAQSFGSRSPEEVGVIWYFEFVKGHATEFSIEAMCRVIGLSRTGYHAFVKRPESARAAEEATLRQEIERIFIEKKKRYGAVRITRKLRKEGCGWASASAGTINLVSTLAGSVYFL